MASSQWAAWRQATAAPGHELAIEVKAIEDCTVDGRTQSSTTLAPQRGGQEIRGFERVHLLFKHAVGRPRQCIWGRSGACRSDDTLTARPSRSAQHFFG
jgi:hypothetical protein